MSKIELGRGAHKIYLDLNEMLGLLLQANSGGGKSWLLRRIMEQAYGHIQILVIDPEGEYASLREKFDFALAGKDGDTPTDVRSAALLAEKLMTLRLSCVCDIYELKPLERHQWVKTFLETLINLPKKLWHPVLIIVDEAHIFMPEKGQGESVALQAMVDIATRGRKRGFKAIYATQRISAMSKAATPILQNYLFGMTFYRNDAFRSAQDLGVNKGAEMNEFLKEIKMLDPGDFYALGRALSKEMIKFKVGNVQTTHPESGSSKHSMTAPPPLAKVRAALPQLSDLPKAAEEKAKTEAELRQEIRSLRTEVTSLKRQQPTAAPRVVEKVVADEKAIERAVAATKKAYEPQLAKCISSLMRIEAAVKDGLTVNSRPEIVLPKLPPAPPPRQLGLERMPLVVKDGFDRKKSGKLGETWARAKSDPNVAVQAEGAITGPEQKILNAIAWMNSIGVDSPEQTAVAFLAGYTIGGGAFNNPRGALRTKGLVEYVAGDCIRLTEAGMSLAATPTTPLTSDEIQRMVLERLPGPEQKILRILIERYPNPINNDELAEASGYSPGGGAYNNPRGRLRTLGLIDYVGGQVVAKKLLFID